MWSCAAVSLRAASAQARHRKRTFGIAGLSGVGAEVCTLGGGVIEDDGEILRPTL